MPCPTAIALKGMTLLIGGLMTGRYSMGQFNDGMYVGLDALVTPLHNQSMTKMAPLLDTVGRENLGLPYGLGLSRRLQSSTTETTETASCTSTTTSTTTTDDSADDGGDSCSNNDVDVTADVDVDADDSESCSNNEIGSDNNNVASNNEASISGGSEPAATIIINSI